RLAGRRVGRVRTVRGERRAAPTGRRGDQAGAGAPFEQGTARNGTLPRAIRLQWLDDVMHDDLRERWLYPSPWCKKKKIGGAGETASTASRTTGYRIDRGSVSGCRTDFAT